MTQRVSARTGPGKPARWLLAAALTVGAAVGLAGCVTSGQGDKIRADIAQLRDRVDAMDRRDAEINEQVGRLRAVLDQATQLLSRNSADLGAKVSKNEIDLATLAGQIEEARHALDELTKKQGDESNRLAALEQTQGKIVDRIAPTIPEDRESLWREAQNRLTGGMREDARRFLRAYIQRFPQDPRSPQARILIGQSYAAEGNHNLAAGEYLKVRDAYPKAPEVPEAMWLLAQSYVELKFCADARALLQDFVQRYPRSPRVPDAKLKMKDLQRMKERKQCSS